MNEIDAELAAKDTARADREQGDDARRPVTAVDGENVVSLGDQPPASPRSNGDTEQPVSLGIPAHEDAPDQQ